MTAKRQRRRCTKVFASAGLLLVLGLLLAACGGDGNGDATGSNPPATADTTSPPATDVELVANPPSPDELVHSDTLSICTETGTPPAAFYDENDQISGYLPEFGEEIAARFGQPATWVDSVFDTIIVAANTGKCDMIIADQFITPEREEQITMIPYVQIGQQLMTTTDKAEELADATTEPSKLCGKTVAVLSGAAQVGTLEKWTKDCSGGGINIVTFSNSPAGLQAMQGGQADAFFTDSPVAGYFAKEQGDQFALAGEPVENVEAGISVPDEQTGVQAALREALAAMKQDGSYEEILANWGQQDLSIENPGQ